MRTPIVSHLLALAWRRRLAVMLLSGAAGAAVACPPSPGATCDSGGEAPASQPLGVGVNLRAGNPINVINGNEYQREEDLPALPGVGHQRYFYRYNREGFVDGDFQGLRQIYGDGARLDAEKP
jgi:hypothetical protein